MTLAGLLGRRTPGKLASRQSISSQVANKGVLHRKTNSEICDLDETGPAMQGKLLNLTDLNQNYEAQGTVLAAQSISRLA